ncbi:hypothetical protein BC831DRAFT_140666 [Entophlyctis helioformis]|nr:hypothetical protein BC831DRAFT_140666 [Entophlyctis helioformis]
MDAGHLLVHCDALMHGLAALCDGCESLQGREAVDGIVCGWMRGVRRAVVAGWHAREDGSKRVHAALQVLECMVQTFSAEFRFGLLDGAACAALCGDAAGGWESVCRATQAVMRGDELVGGNVQQQQLYAVGGRLLCRDRPWAWLLAALASGSIEPRVVMPCLRDLGASGWRDDAVSSLVERIDAAVHEQQQTAFTVLLCAVVVVSGHDTGGLAKALGRVLVSGSRLALKAGREWIIGLGETSWLRMLPTSVLKVLAVTLRGEAAWQPFADGIKARLAELGESLNDRRQSVSSSLRLDKVLSYYEEHGKVPPALVDASIFQVQWYTKTFLPGLLRGKKGVNHATRLRLVQVLRQGGRIPKQAMEAYERETKEGHVPCIDDDDDMYGDEEPAGPAGGQVQPVQPASTTTAAMMDKTDAVRLMAEIDQTVVGMIEHLKSDSDGDGKTDAADTAMAEHAKWLMDTLARMSQCLVSIKTAASAVPPPGSFLVGLDVTTRSLVVQGDTGITSAERRYVQAVFGVAKQLSDHGQAGTGHELLRAVCGHATLYPAVVEHLHGCLMSQGGDAAQVAGWIQCVQQCAAAGIGEAQSKIRMIRHNRGTTVKPADEDQAESQSLAQALLSGLADGVCSPTLFEMQVACQWLMQSGITDTAIRRYQAGDGFVGRLVRQLDLFCERVLAATSSADCAPPAAAMRVSRQIRDALWPKQPTSIQAGLGVPADEGRRSLDGVVGRLRAWVRAEALFPRELEWLDDTQRMVRIKLRVASAADEMQQVWPLAATMTAAADSNDRRGRRRSPCGAVCRRVLDETVQVLGSLPGPLASRSLAVFVPALCELGEAVLEARADARHGDGSSDSSETQQAGEQHAQFVAALPSRLSALLGRKQPSQPSQPMQVE